MDITPPGQGGSLGPWSSSGARWGGIRCPASSAFPPQTPEQPQELLPPWANQVGALQTASRFVPAALGLGEGVSPPGRGRARRVCIVFSAFINHGSLWPLPRARHNSGWVINRILGSFRLIKAEGGGAAGRRHDYITLSLPCQNKEYRRCRPLFLQHISARLLTPHFRPNQGLKNPTTTPPPVSQWDRAVGCPAPQLVAQLPLDFAGELSTVHPPARRRDRGAGAAGAQPDLRLQAGEGAEAPGVDVVVAGGGCCSAGGDVMELPAPSPQERPGLEVGDEALRPTGVS